MTATRGFFVLFSGDCAYSEAEKHNTNKKVSKINRMDTPEKNGLKNNWEQLIVNVYSFFTKIAGFAVNHFTVNIFIETHNCLWKLPSNCVFLQSVKRRKPDF
jgi:hypothetical protein